MTLRYRIVAMLAGLTLALTACGGGDDDAADTGTVDDTANADDTATDGGDNVSDDAGDETSDDASDDGADDDGDMAEQPDYTAFNGEFDGHWSNETFGSTGSANVMIDVSADGMATVTVDLDGNVLGGSDPDPETFSFNVADADLEAGMTIESATFGTTVVTLDGGTITVTADAVPANGIAAFEAEGDLSSSALVGTYTVTFDDGSTADGTFQLASV